MNRLLLALAITATVGCGGSDTKNKDIAIPLNSADQKFVQLIGVWMSDRYLTKIEESRSVFENKESEPQLLAIRLKEANLASASPILYGFTSHEGGIEIPIRFDQLSKKYVYDETRSTYSPSLNSVLELDLLDTNKLMVRFGQSKLGEVYRKVDDEQTELRRVLFEGAYSSTKGDRRFTFSRSGNLEGFGNATNFEVIYDFGLNIEFDAIVMYDKLRTGNWSDGEIYKYDFDSSILKLYHVTVNWETLAYTVDDLTYELRVVK